MLKQRVITALLLLTGLLTALFYPAPWVFCWLSLGLMAVGAWEWARLNGSGMSASLMAAGLSVVVCGGLWWAGVPQHSTPLLWLTVGAVWVLLGAWVLWAGVSDWALYPRWLRLSLGWLALGLAWLALSQARVIGINFLLSTLGLVWVADIGAYFAGRALGGRFCSSKLAPSISPGKSWEGVWGGLLSVVVLALAWHQWDEIRQLNEPSLFTLVGLRGVLYSLIACVFMVAMSVVGDLIESLVKRSAGVKDSSALLPGHGGVLDRVDALLPILPLAMMLYSL